MLAINLPLQEYERNSTTKFSCYSSDKGFRKIVKFNIWKGGRGIIFQKKKKIIKTFLKISCSKNLGKLWGGQQSNRSFLVELHAKSGYLNDVGN